MDGKRRIHTPKIGPQATKHSARKMPPISQLEEAVVHVLEETRSVADTARHLKIPVRDVQRVAMMAFGLGRLDVALVDY
jgi:hypothetical protein